MHRDPRPFSKCVRGALIDLGGIHITRIDDDDVRGNEILVPDRVQARTKFAGAIQRTNDDRRCHRLSPGSANGVVRGLGQLRCQSSAGAQRPGPPPCRPEVRTSSAHERTHRPQQRPRAQSPPASPTWWQPEVDRRALTSGIRLGSLGRFVGAVFEHSYCRGETPDQTVSREPRQELDSFATAKGCAGAGADPLVVTGALSERRQPNERRGLYRSTEQTPPIKHAFRRWPLGPARRAVTAQQGARNKVETVDGAG